MHIGGRGGIDNPNDTSELFYSTKTNTKRSSVILLDSKSNKPCNNKMDKKGKIKETTNTSNDQDKIKQKTKIKIEYKHWNTEC